MLLLHHGLTREAIHVTRTATQHETVVREMLRKSEDEMWPVERAAEGVRYHLKFSSM